MNAPRGLFGLAMTLGLAISAAAAAKPPAAVWKEGEDFTEAPSKQVKVIGEKASASGGRVLWGLAMNKKGQAVRYEANLAGAVPDARIIFRYARQHWKEGMTAAAIPLEITGGGRTLRGDVVFDQTGGWGNRPREWGLVTVDDLGTLAAGKWSLKLTCPADDSDICIDGFWIAPPGLRLTPEEFAPLLAVQVGAEGYLGLRACTTAMDQKAGKGLLAVVRNFAGPGGAVKATLTDSAGKSVALAPGAATAEGPSGAERIAFSLPAVADGPYTLKLSCERPALTLDVPVVLAGELLAGFAARLEALRVFAKELPGMGPAALKCKDDFDYALEYLPARERELRDSAMPADSNEALDRVAALKVREPAVLLGNLSRTLAQYEETAQLLRARTDPCAGRTGDLRRTFVTKALEAPVRCRIYVPSNYAKADKAPLAIVLHGSKDDEDGMAAQQNGRIFELAEKRGYIMVCPHYNKDRDGKYMDAVGEVLAQVRADYPKIDPARIFATGFSMGGYAASELGTFHPEVLAAVSCGGGAGMPEWVQNLKIPIQVVQGGADAVVTPERTARSVKLMEDAGIRPEVHILPFVGHEYLADEFMGRALDFFDKHPRASTATTTAP